MHNRKDARLIKRGEIEEPPQAHPWPPDPEPPGPPEKTEFRAPPRGRMFHAAGPAAWIRLDAIETTCPPWIAESLVKTGSIPGRSYRSGFLLADAEALRKAWAKIKSEQIERSES